MKKDIHKLKKQEAGKIRCSARSLTPGVCLTLTLLASFAFALEPREILIIANSDVNESLRLAQYYCLQRAVPPGNILKIPLDSNLVWQIDRAKYNNVLAAAIKEELSQRRLPGEIKCLLTVYGVPIKVGPAAAMDNAQQFVLKLSAMLDAKKQQFNDLLSQLNNLGRQELINQNPSVPQSYEDTFKHLDDDIKQALKRIEYIEQRDVRKQQYEKLTALLKGFYGIQYAQQQSRKFSQISFKLSALEEDRLRKNNLILEMAAQDNWSIEKKLGMNFYEALEFVAGTAGVIADIKADIGRCRGQETAASVDSELSMLLFENYDLYRWQKNELYQSSSVLPAKTLMVSRLDGPSYKIAAGLIDKAIEAGKNGLSGNAYIDARGLNITAEPPTYSLEFFDKSLHLLAAMLKKRTSLNVVVENTNSLFQPGSCPQTALYCGWYSVKKYIDAFDFVPGAIGFHIASFEAMDLRKPSSSNWCPAMLSDGITATLGPIDEPYLHSFPLPNQFFAELLNGNCLVEAFYKTNPFNSWQLVLIGDPLYKPKFK